MNDLISIVVPIYNVSKYLIECLDSLKSQSYSNIEVLLINDGSTDNSEQLCLDYLKFDNRFKYYFKENGGLSDARNYGIVRASGQYIMFIDSDDIVHRSYVETLYNMMLYHNSDIAMCGYQRFFKNEDIENPLGNTSFVCSKEKVLEKILYQNCQNVFSVSAACKLYRTSIFNEIRFPVGKYNEDMYIIFDVINNSQTVSVIDRNLYYYRINPSSITQEKFSKKRMDAIEASKILLEKCETSIPILANGAICMIYSRAVELLTIAKFSTNKNEFVNEKNELISIIKKYRNNVLFDNKCRKKARMSAVLSYINIDLILYILNFIRNQRYK